MLNTIYAMHSPYKAEVPEPKRNDLVASETTPVFSLLNHLDDVLVAHHVRDTDPLGRVLGRDAPHERILKLCGQRTMNCVANVLYCNTLLGDGRDKWRKCFSSWWITVARGTAEG